MTGHLDKQRTDRWIRIEEKKQFIAIDWFMFLNLNVNSFNWIHACRTEHLNQQQLRHKLHPLLYLHFRCKP